MKLKRSYKITNTILLIIQVCFILISIIMGFKLDLLSLTPTFISNIAMDYVCMAICVILFISCLVTSNLTQKDQYFRNLILLINTGLFADAVCWFVQGNPKLAIWNQLANFVFYAVLATMSFFAWIYMYALLSPRDEKGKIFFRFMAIFYIIDIISVIINNFFGYFFSVDFETGMYTRGSFYMLSNIMPTLMVVLSLIYLVHLKCSIPVKASFFAIFLMPSFAAVIQIYVFGLSLVCVFCTFALLIVYVNIYVELTQRYIVAQNKAAEQDKELGEMRTRIMISQIQPHFLYNTLTTIHALCGFNPEKAGEITEKFANYLRGNISSLGSKEAINFTEELQHTKIYTDIEMERFDNITVNYEIQDSDFKIPALSLQPLVENSIRHGVRIRDNGIVTVKAYKDEKNAYVVVEDNGKGFIPGQMEGNGNHIGLKNIQQRIETMMNGTFNIESILDVGTKITITLPLTTANQNVENVGK